MKTHVQKCLLFCALASLSYAANPVGFDAYDTNKDGVLLEDEFNAAKAARMSAKADAGMPMRNAGNSPDFSFFDTNKDGKVTKEEFQAGQLKRMQENRQNRSSK